MKTSTVVNAKFTFYQTSTLVYTGTPAGADDAFSLVYTGTLIYTDTLVYTGIPGVDEQAPV